MAVNTFNSIYKPVFSTKARYIHIWGGRGRGGSHFATDYALFLITQPAYFRGVFMREVFNDIRTSLFADFKDRVSENGTYNEVDFAIVDNTMTIKHLPTGNTIISKGFRKSDNKQSAKLKSLAGCTHIFIEECEENYEDDFNMLDSSLRTTKADIQVIMVFNPPNKNHWIIKNSYNLVDSGIAGYFTAQLKNRTDTLSIFSTYKQNIKNINNKTIEIFENYKTSNSDYYYRMICGLVSEGKVGRIFKNWLPITEKEFFDLPYPMYMGLDIGYSSDPTALVIIKKYKNNLYVHELLYDLNLSNEDIAKRIIAFGYDKVLMYCELETGNKLTDHLRKLKVFAMPAKKGAGSINYGINELKANQIHYTETSKNLIFEYENYTWLLDARKMPTDTPSDKDNHLLDALRYVYYTCLVEGRIANDKVIEQTQTQRTSKIRKPKNTKNYVSDFR